MSKSSFGKATVTAMIAATVALVVGLAIHWADDTEPAATTVATDRNAPDRYARVSGGSPPTPAQRSVERATTSPRPSLGDEFNRLVGTGDPTDAFRAYDLATRCAESRADEKAAELQAPGERSAETIAALKDGSFRVETAANCENLTSTQIDDRVKYLRQAAEAGVSMAAIRLVEYGPWGDPTALATRPNDPAVLEWRHEMVGLIELAAGKGDYAAMDSLSTMYRTGSGLLGERDPGKALMYATAKWEAYRQATGRTSAFAAQEVSQLASALTPQAASAATAAGREFAVAALAGARR